MIPWLLARLERNPHTVFHEKELVERFAKEFAEAKRERLLERVATGSVYGHEVSRPRTIIDSEGGGFEAYDDDDPDADPIELTVADLLRWRLNLATLALEVQGANGMTGVPDAVGRCTYFIGERKFDGGTLAFVLGLFVDEEVALESLRALPNSLATSYDRFVVLCPTFIPAPQLRRELESMRVFCVPLWKNGTFSIDFAEFFMQSHKSVVRRIVLNDDEETEFEAQGFSSRTPVEVTGKTEPRKGNVIYVGGGKTTMGDVPFRAFIRLLTALYQTRSGFVEREALTKENGTDGVPGVITGSFDQAIDRIRKPFAGVLDRDITENQFIERRDNSVRISTHRRFVSCDRFVLEHRNPSVRALAALLPSDAFTQAVARAPASRGRGSPRAGGPARRGSSPSRT